MKNCNYNVMRQLTKKLSFLNKVDLYIEDAEKEGHALCVEMWKEIKTDEQKHVDKLKAAIHGKCKEKECKDL